MGKHIKPPRAGTRGGQQEVGVDRNALHHSMETPCGKIEVRPRLHAKLTKLLSGGECFVVSNYGSQVQFLVQRVEVLS